MTTRDEDPFARRDHGMEVATSHADAVVENWRYLARDMLERYLREHDKPFLTQDLILWAREQGLPEPPTKKAWGAVVTVAARRHMIKIDSYTKEGTYNANMKPLWKATESHRMRLLSEDAMVEELDFRMGIVREPGDEEDVDTEWPEGPNGPFVPGGTIVPRPTPEADDALGVPPGYREQHPAPEPPAVVSEPATQQGAAEPSPAPCERAPEPEESVTKSGQGSLF